MTKRTKETQDSHIYDISDLNPVMVIQALFNNAKQQGWGLTQGYTASLSDEQARLIYENHVQSRRWIDWEHGRPLKISLLNLQEVCVSAYNKANGEGMAEAAFDAVRSGTTYSDIANDSASAVQEFKNNISYMKNILEGIVQSEEEIVRHAIEQTDLGRSFTITRFGSDSRASDKTADKTEENKVGLYEYLCKNNQISGGTIQTCNKVKYDKEIIDQLFEHGNYIYCESKSNGFNPSNNPIYACENFAGVKQCIDELKSLGCGFQLYASSTMLTKMATLKNIY